MLKLDNIVKDYNMGSDTVHALRGISLELRKNEFVSVLGPSGCGKTTMLNIIGGLDRYTSGDLIIDGKSTKDFKDTEWDSYRNGVIGMVFQNYNLIPHLSVLENVSIALTLSGTGVSERKERAKQALIDVGLESQMNKKPNQLSGGQMQRVAIARALVNNPDILLADEPTGALDTKTSVQVMEILKKISGSRLVIMVTHNEQLAEAYSDRIVKLVDGRIVDDSSPYQNGSDAGKIEKLKNKKTSMSFWTAVRHSFKNLNTKKARSILTSVAGSIGIMGIALVLALSNGMSGYITRMQSDTMAGFPVSISQTASSFMDRGSQGDKQEEFPDGTKIYTHTSSSGSVHVNKIGDSYLTYLEGLDSKLYNSISYSYGLEMNIITKAENGTYKKVSAASQSSIFGSSSYFSELPDNPEFIDSQYDILASSSGRLPQNANEAALVLDSYNRIDSELLTELGINIADDYEFSDLIGKELKVIKNNTYYSETAGIFVEGTDYENMYNDASSVSVKITAILRVKESASAELLSQGIVYTGDLTKTMLESSASSFVASAQIEAGETRNVLTGGGFNALVTYDSVMKKIGADSIPTGIQIYPVDFDAKDKVKDYLDAYNTGKIEEDRIVYTDLAESISNMTSTLINTITIALAAFAGISLLVSSIMIGIITYVSVVERTKEIGILRAIGARKKDISRLFNAETLIIGFAAGLIGIILTLILSIPLNMIISSLAGISGIVSLPVWAAFALIALSMALTFIAGLFPSRIAAKKDPVLALRTE